MITFDFRHFVSKSWYPGHMAKASRQIKEKLSLVDLVLVILDARIPESSLNYELTKVIDNKARVFILNKTDLSEDEITKTWANQLREENIPLTYTDTVKRSGLDRILPLVRTTINDDRTARGATRPMLRPYRILIMGVPNVGKSSLINALVRRNRAKTGRTPGVTQHQQWIKLAEDIELLDTPGIMMPGSISKEQALKMGLCHIIRQDLVGPHFLCEYLLYQLFKKKIQNRLSLYNIDSPQPDIQETLKAVAISRGALKSGGEPDREQAALIILKDFSDGRLGKVSLDIPESINQNNDVEIQWE
jgi:ribosome biogenesis GTPase A